MTKRPSRWLDAQSHDDGSRPGKALVTWLNDADHSHPFVEQLVADAGLVFQGLVKYDSLHQLVVAQRKKKIASDFWKSLERLNETMATFTYAPQVDPHEFYDGRRLSRSLVAEEPTAALFALQVQWVLELVERGAILRVRRCEQCKKWYLARFSIQRFCTDSCRGKHFSQSDTFKAHRRKYMRELYHLKKSGYVK